MLQEIQKGKLLLSEPSMLLDTIFGRSVIFLTEYNDQGAVGFIINKPIEHNLSDLIPDIKTALPVYKGGPVEQDSLFFIHNQPDLIPYATEVSEGIFWGGDFEIVKELLNNGSLTQKNIRFFLGYSGWKNGQLEEEMDEHSWILVQNTYKSNLLTKAQSDFWKEQLVTLGDKYAIWANAPENPELN